MTTQIDVLANRGTRKWTRRELLGRLMWSICHPLFRFSPRPFWVWRAWMLRRFGAQIGRHVHIYPTVQISIPWNLSVGDQAAIGDRAIVYALGRIQIGARTTVSQGAHLCAGTHDWRDPARPLRRPPITVGQDAWLCADTFVGPGVAIGDGAILGARGVAMRDLPPRSVSAGNPARIVGTTE